MLLGKCVRTSTIRLQIIKCVAKLQSKNLLKLTQFTHFANSIIPH